MPKRLSDLDARRTERAVLAYERMRVDLRQPKRDRPNSQPSQKTFPALITGHEMIAPNYWKYSAVEAVRGTAPDRWVPDPDGRTTTINADTFGIPCFNGFETPNDGAGDEGFGVNVDEAGFTIAMKPIPNGMKVTIAIHRDIEGNRFWEFEAPNAYTITCSGATEPEPPPQPLLNPGRSPIDPPIFTT